MRWSEERLEEHLNNHRNKDECSKLKEKAKNDVRVQQAKQSLLNRKSERNRTGEETEILNCEIPQIPPSVNHYWETAGKRRFLSNRARDFHDLVQLMVPAHRSTARLKLIVTFHFPNRQTRDIDNYLKATIDSLVKCGLCVDDEQFDELQVSRGEIIKGGLIKIKVLEI